MEKLTIILEKIDALNLRERAIVFVGVLALLFSLWDGLLMSPLGTQQKKMVADLNTKNTERLVLSTRMQELVK